MKKLLTILLSLSLATSALAGTLTITHGSGTFTLTHPTRNGTATLATSQIIMGGGDLSPSTSAVNYAFIQDQMETFQTVASKASGAVPTSGTFRNLRIDLDTAPDNGAETQSYTYTIFKNGLATNLTCVISEAGLTCSDTTNSLLVVAGDLITLGMTPLGTPVATTNPIYSVQFDPNVSGESIFLGGSRFAIVAGGGLPYLPLGGDGKNGTDIAFNALALIPTSGSLTNLVVTGASDPGAGNSYIWTVQTATNGGGTLADTTLTCTQTSGQTGCTVTGSVSLTADDVAILKLTYGGTPANTLANWGVTFTASNPGEFILASTSKTPSQTVTQYGHVSSLNNNDWNNGENNAQQSAQAMTIKAIYAEVAGALGVGNSVTITLRKNGVSDANLTCTITSNGRRCNKVDTIDGFTATSIVTGDLLATEHIPTSIPTQQNATISYLAYIAPVTTTLTITH